jgi:hypothetical protein
LLDDDVWIVLSLADVAAVRDGGAHDRRYALLDIDFHTDSLIQN